MDPINNQPMKIAVIARDAKDYEDFVNIRNEQTGEPKAAFYMVLKPENLQGLRFSEVAYTWAATRGDNFGKMLNDAYVRLVPDTAEDES